MKKNIFMTGVLFLFVSGLFLPDASARRARDIYRFGSRGFLIQLVSEAGKSTKGIWDLPGDGDLDKKAKKRKTNLQLWKRDKGKDGKDRIFSFKPTATKGKYYIEFKNYPGWKVNAYSSSKNVKASRTGDRFELRHLGGGKWKIYYRDDMIVRPKRLTSKNGINIVIGRDSNSKLAQWAFYDARTGRPFVPKYVYSKEKPKKAEEANKVTDKNRLETALLYKGKGNRLSAYLSSVSYAQFKADNKDGLLEKTLSSRENGSEQYNEILKAIEGVQNSRHVAVKRAAARALSEVQINKGNDFTSRLFKGKVKKTIGKKASAERDSTTKRYLNKLAKNFK